MAQLVVRLPADTRSWVRTRADALHFQRKISQGLASVLSLQEGRVFVETELTRKLTANLLKTLTQKLRLNQCYRKKKRFCVRTLTLFVTYSKM